MAVQIFNYDGWRVYSVGNGAAYNVECPQCVEGYSVQYGDDAAQFRKSFDELDELSPQAVIQHLLAEYMPESNHD